MSPLHCIYRAARAPLRGLRTIPRDPVGKAFLVRLSTLPRAAAVALAALFASSSGRAAPSVPERPPAPRYSPWQTKKMSPFVSLATDAGFIYFRPRLTLGYGAPFWNYVGVQADAITTNSFFQTTVGWRASLPFLDCTLSVRSVYPYDRRYLPRQKAYSAVDLGLDHPGAQRSAYDAVDLEIAAVAPLLHGGVFVELHPLYVDAPRGTNLYEEYIRAVIRPPFALGTRAGYLYGVDKDESVKIGFMSEYVVLPGRPSNVTRIGPVASVNFGKHFDGFAALSFVVSSPDTLGLENGTYAFIGVLHRWAHSF